MRKFAELNSDIFEDLLGHFSADREEAGRRYGQLRAGLVRFFDFRGCADPETLADETIDRVALKIGGYDASQGTRLTAYFYGFASNVLREHMRLVRRELPLADVESIAQPAQDDRVDADLRDRCLQSCLDKLSVLERDIIVKYYGSEREEKAAVRQEMCGRFECTPGALHTKIFRIKTALRICMDECLRSA